MSLIHAMHRYAAALNVAGKDESAERQSQAFLDEMGGDVRMILTRDDYEWIGSVVREAYEAGWYAGLGRAAELANRALEEAA